MAETYRFYDLIIGYVCDFVRSHNVKIDNPVEFSIEENKRIDNSYIKIKLPDISHIDYYYVDNIGKYILKTTKIQLYVDSYLLDDYVITNYDRYYMSCINNQDVLIHDEYPERLEKNNKECLLFIKLLPTDHFSYFNTNTEISFGNFKFVIQIGLVDIKEILQNDDNCNIDDNIVNYIKNNIKIELING